MPELNPPIRSLTSVIEEITERRGKPEFGSKVLEWVLRDLAEIAAMKDAYNWQDRGKTLRANELRRLKKLIHRLQASGACMTDEERDWVRQAAAELSAFVIPLNGTPSADLDAAMTLEKRLKARQSAKMTLRWRPYLYGTLLPEAGLRHASIPLSLAKSNGLHRGLIIDFVRAALREMGEADVEPESIARALKRVKGGRRDIEPSAEIPFPLQETWEIEHASFRASETKGKAGRVGDQ